MNGVNLTKVSIGTLVSLLILFAGLVAWKTQADNIHENNDATHETLQVADAALEKRVQAQEQISGDLRKWTRAQEATNREAARRRQEQTELRRWCQENKIPMERCPLK